MSNIEAKINELKEKMEGIKSKMIKSIEANSFDYLVEDGVKLREIEAQISLLKEIK